MPVSFAGVVEQLQERYSGVAIGDTADHGQYHKRAIEMRFAEVNNYIFASNDGRRTMWLYVNRPLNKICCGDKPWPEAEHFRLTGEGNP